MTESFRPPTGQGLRAFLVAVDYNDLLAITLPWNRHHFDQVHIIMSIARNEAEGRIADMTIALAATHGCQLFCTDAFYANGAKFNKWLALEQCLAARGRHGWICLMDADILWPKRVDLWRILRPGFLYTPRRLMMDPPPRNVSEVPPEAEWDRKFPIHPQGREFAGYTQIFHGSDPVLGATPWHQVDWMHCGGADSFFQAKWPMEQKIRPNFKVLHLGPAGVNWFGRASAYAGGGTPEEGPARREALRRMLLGRRDRRGLADPFAPERLPPSS